jgi:hypothetical protein
VPQSLQHRSEPSAKNEQGEYATFETALKKVLSVPRSVITAKLDAEKRVRKQRKKRPSVRASRAKA